MSYYVIGYIDEDNIIYCRHCAPIDKYIIPIFAGTEWDYIPCCYVCGDEIDVCMRDIYSIDEEDEKEGIDED